MKTAWKKRLIANKKRQKKRREPIEKSIRSALPSTPKPKKTKKYIDIPHFGGGWGLLEDSTQFILFFPVGRNGERKPDQLVTVTHEYFGEQISNVIVPQQQKNIVELQAKQAIISIRWLLRKFKGNSCVKEKRLKTGNRFLVIPKNCTNSAEHLIDFHSVCIRFISRYSLHIGKPQNISWQSEIKIGGSKKVKQIRVIFPFGIRTTFKEKDKFCTKPILSPVPKLLKSEINIYFPFGIRSTYYKPKTAPPAKAIPHTGDGAY